MGQEHNFGLGEKFWIGTKLSVGGKIVGQERNLGWEQNFGLGAKFWVGSRILGQE